MIAVSVIDSQREINYDKMKLRLYRLMSLTTCRFEDIVVFILSKIQAVSTYVKTNMYIY